MLALTKLNRAHRERCKGEGELKSLKSLCDLPIGQEALIESIEGGHGLRNRILSIGIHPSDRIRVIRSSPFKGPLLVENLDQGFCLALGRGMAARVLVRTGNERIG